jgi:hypothetical protein
MTEDQDRKAMEALMVEAGRTIFPVITKVLNEELRDHPEILKRIYARLLGLEGKP